MLDKQLLRDDADGLRAALDRRGDYGAILARFTEIDLQRRALQVELDTARSERNAISQQIGTLMKAGQRDEAEQLKAQAQQINARAADLESRFGPLEETERDLLLSLPNLPAEDIPTGGEEAAQIVKEHGEPKRFEFEAFDHVELCRRLELVNFEAGARITGGGFPVLVGQGAQLQRALINFMLDLHISRHGYTEIRPPFIVHPRAALGTGQLPKFAEDMYWITDPHRLQGSAAVSGRELEGATDNAAGTEARPPVDERRDAAATGPDFLLIPTAEVPVANYYREQILDAPQLPLKLCAYSPCWRVEGGSYGRDARGLTRLHQFEKVELVCIAAPEASWDVLEQMTREAETVLELLGLAYRRKVLPSGDMAFASAKTYDLEVYCPAEEVWREISSASNTTDYQSRRMNLRYRPERGDKPSFPHMLNASGLALPRLIIALLETYQTGAGTVEVPAVLRPYLPGLEELTPPENGVPFV